jgi:hypothetical protein
MKPIPADPNFVARFEVNIDRSGDPSACALWLGSPGEDSYGTFTWTGPKGERWKYRAHRLALTLADPPTHDGLYALHHCDTPMCCNTGPDHLYWGTARDNAADRDRPYRRWQLRNRKLADAGQQCLFVPSPAMFATAAGNR